MEEKKKFDVNSLIGFLLIGGIILYMLNLNQKEEAKKQQEAKQQTESVATATATDSSATASIDSLATPTDSTAIAQASQSYGPFAYAAGLPSAQEATTTIENELVEIKVSNKGGQITEVKLKQQRTHDSLPIYLVKDNNASFNLNIPTQNGTINTQNLYFTPQVTKSGGNTILSMKLKVSADKYLEYVYTLKPDDYMMDFNIRSKGLSGILNASTPVQLNWKMKSFSYGRSITYENRYTEAVWYYEGDKNSSERNGTDKDKDVDWIAFRQHFFTSILLKDTPFKAGEFTVTDLVKNEDVDTTFSKAFAASLPLQIKSGELNANMNLYYGPSDYKILDQYKRHLDKVVPMGWGIFGWINMYIFIPLLNFFMSFLPAGIAIILMTIMVKLILSPIQYKQYLSQAKQKILSPEIKELQEKYKDNKMKLQQETMALNRKAGINPASGCLVGLIQLPIFYALFELFPSAFNLRHQSFLWADDLASYDVIAHLPFKIPFYGDHVSLFPLLASVAIFFYMMLTTGQTMQKQPGMPNMKFIMYLSPLFMLFFFNSYPSGLSLYYLTSNLISIGIVLVIKKFILDENKIHAKIQENKKKPKKQSRFQRKMQEMMQEAERQKNMKK